MALYPCRECAKRISEFAKVCPQCGAVDPIRAGEAKRLNIAIGCLRAGSAVALAVVIMAGFVALLGWLLL